LTKRKN